jgi:hypothetical protein
MTIKEHKAIRAHSKYQYNKWQDWNKGLIKNEDMFILAQTYWNEINSLVRSKGFRIEGLTDSQIFKMVAENIEYY